MINRIIMSLVVLIGASFVNHIYNPVATLVAGQAAGDQFAASDIAFLKTNFIFSALTGGNLAITAITLLALVGIWFTPTKKFFTAMVTLLVMGLVVVGGQDKAWAFAETTDKTEAYTILPNESAFWIPDVGNNKDTQARLESEQYLNDNKIASKRFIIPHAKLSGSGGTSLLSGWDYYVPTGRLVIVDRTPYSREWVKSSDRGTAHGDQSFPCQSKEGLNVTVGVSIGASVSETDAAKFLYRFGVTAPKGNRNDPQVIFTSVYYGRSLADVMDDVGRKKVQTLVCNEISARTLDAVNADAPLMMTNIQKSTKEYFATVGITLDFIGWADTFEFNDIVQKAIDDKWAAQKLADALPILQATAGLRVQEGLGKGMENHGLPIVVTPEMIAALLRMAPVAPIPATK